MALTEITYTGDGSDVTFGPIPFPYLEDSDVLITINGVATTAFTIDPSTKIITFSSAPADGTVIRVYRNTNNDTLAATFISGSAIRAVDLNDNFTQNLYVIQEIDNNAVQTDGSTTMVGDLDMGGYKVTNLAAPVAGTDAANRNFVEDSLASEFPIFYRRWSKTAAGGETSLSGNDDNGIALSYVAGSEKVFINGALQVRGIDYSGTTGTTLTGIPALIAGDIVEVHSSSNYTVGTVPDGSVTNAKVDGGAAIQYSKLALGNSIVNADVNSAAGIAASKLSFTQAGTGAVARTVDSKLADVVSVKDFGAVGDGVADDTAAIQAAINYVKSRPGSGPKRLYFPSGAYNVTQVTVDGSGLDIFFDDALLVGIASSPTTSIIQIKGGFNHIHGLKVVGNFIANYQCGVHWYTNDLNSFYPGRNRFDGLHVQTCKIGLVVGALPSQADPIPAQGTVQADGVATDAPVSESYVHGFQTYACVRGLYFRQPNGKVSFVNPDVTGEDNDWLTYADRTETCAIQLERGELSVVGGDVQQIQQIDGALVRVNNGNLNLISNVIESVAPIHIQGPGNVRISNILNWGLNNESTAFFFVKDDCTGNLDISDSWIVRNAGYSGGWAIFKSVSSLSTGSFSPNTKFFVNLSNVEIRDPNWTQGSTYNPIAQGLRVKFKNCWMTGYSGTTRVASRKIDEGENLLMGKVDLPADTVTAYAKPAASSGTSGGWTFSNTSTAGGWGSSTASLPSPEGITANKALLLSSTSGAAVYATSPKFNVEPQRTYVLRGWARTNANNATIIFRLNWYNFSGSAASTASTDSYYGTGQNFIGSTWSPFMLWFQAPADATQAELYLHAENEADLYTVNLELV
jgi:hypothetical protein